MARNDIVLDSNTLLFHCNRFSKQKAISGTFPLFWKQPILAGIHKFVCRAPFVFLLKLLVSPVTKALTALLV